MELSAPLRNACFRHPAPFCYQSVTRCSSVSNNFGGCRFFDKRGEEKNSCAAGESGGAVSPPEWRLVIVRKF